MISVAEQKRIKQLQLKKQRYLQGLFVAEGDKIVAEALQSDFQIQRLYITPEFLAKHKTILQRHLDIALIVPHSEVKRISFLEEPQHALAVMAMPTQTTQLPQTAAVALHQLQDPGNMGTIMRTCDWFGIHHLLICPNTVDPFSPKSVQASMGSIFRMHISFLESLEYLRAQAANRLFALHLKGENIYESNLPSDAIFLFGNEGQGFQETELAGLKWLTIPGKGKAESLNVAISTAITLSEWSRRG